MQIHACAKVDQGQPFPVACADLYTNMPHCGKRCGTCKHSSFDTPTGSRIAAWILGGKWSELLQVGRGALHKFLRDFDLMRPGE